jgi:hypothetical protein
MNENLYRYGGFDTKLGSVDICHQDRLYTIECGLIATNSYFSNNKLLVAIWLNDQSPLHLGKADFVCSVFVDSLRSFVYSKDLPEDLISEIEYQAKRFEKLKAFI